MKLCDLTVEQYLGITQAWGTGVWILFTGLTLAGAWIWKRARARKLAAAEPLAPSMTFDGTPCRGTWQGCTCDLDDGHPGPHNGIISWWGQAPPA